MNNIKLPGFTAEASFGQTPGCYRDEGRFGGADKSRAVVPQRIKLRDVHCACNAATDICVCDNGRVIHMTLGEIR